MTFRVEFDGGVNMKNYKPMHTENSDAVKKISNMKLPIEDWETMEKEIESSLYLYQQYNKRGASPRDIIHVAAMMGEGLDKIVSVDKHFDIIEEVDRIDPFDLGL
jgi:predicted nucleic acid-binding protein